MSWEVGQAEGGAEGLGAKILPFLPRHPATGGALLTSAATASPLPDASDRLGNAAVDDQTATRRRPLLGAQAAQPDDSTSGNSLWRRLPSARRRPAPAPATATLEQLVGWLQSLEQGGVSAVQWNSTSVTLAQALVRARRMVPGSVVEVAGHRILAVELIRLEVEAEPEAR